MEEARIGPLQMVILDLDPGQEMLVASKSEATRDFRLRSIGAKNVPVRNSVDARKNTKRSPGQAKREPGSHKGRRSNVLRSTVFEVQAV